jgi:hypothetical protein
MNLFWLKIIKNYKFIDLNVNWPSFAAFAKGGIRFTIPHGFGPRDKYQCTHAPTQVVVNEMKSSGSVGHLSTPSILGFKTTDLFTKVLAGRPVFQNPMQV